SLTEDFVRRAPSRTARGQQNAGAEEQPHAPSRKRCISASSSAIHEAICSRENLRGGGSFTPEPRKRVARNKMSSCFSSGGSASAAASISASVLMENFRRADSSGGKFEIFPRQRANVPARCAEPGFFREFHGLSHRRQWDASA